MNANQNENTTTKTCSKCGETKALTDFHRERRNKDGHAQQCKPCRCANTKAWRNGTSPRGKGTCHKRVHDNGLHCPGCVTIKPTSAFDTDRSRPEGHSGHCKPCRKERHGDYYRAYEEKRKHCLSTRYHNYVQNSRRTNRTFELTLECFASITSQPCIYCNGYEPEKDHTGIDRLDNSRGYLLDNIAPACWPCNRLKGCRSLPQFITDVLTQAGRYSVIAAHIRESWELDQDCTEAIDLSSILVIPNADPVLSKNSVGPENGDGSVNLLGFTGAN